MTGKVALITENLSVSSRTNAPGFPLAVQVTRPAVGGPFPLALLTHGVPAPIFDFFDFAPAAQAFARAGYAAAVLFRCGFGPTGGHKYEKTKGCKCVSIPSIPCEDPNGGNDCTLAVPPNYVFAGKTAANDIVDAVEGLFTKPWVRPTAVLVGHSVGGLACLAASAREPALAWLAAVVNFAGGHDSRLNDPEHNVVCPGGAPRCLCDEPQLIADFGTFGKTSRAPSLWLYATDDNHFSPALADRLRRSFDPDLTPRIQMRYPAPPGAKPYDHPYFYKQHEDWSGHVFPFLKSLGLP